MANSTQVTALASSIQRKSVYRGNVQAIPVTLVPASDTAHVISETLPPNTYVIGAALACSGLAGSATLTIGTNSDADAILASTSVSSAALVSYPAAASVSGPVSVGEKYLTITTAGGTYSSETIVGYILIVTDE